MLCIYIKMLFYNKNPICACCWFLGDAPSSVQDLMIPLPEAQLLLRSTTITLMLSQLLRPKARRVRSAAANMLRDGYRAPAPSSLIWGPALTGGGFSSRRHCRATLQAKSPDKTSHKPSLARSKQSSTDSLFVKVISGSGITNGFKYSSPGRKKKSQKTNNWASNCSSVRHRVEI